MLRDIRVYFDGGHIIEVKTADGRIDRAQIDDLSSAGVGIKTTQQYSAGQITEMTFSVYGYDFHLVGKVERLGSIVFIKFTHLRDRDKDNLEHLLNLHGTFKKV